jgi:hypothetical protein
MPKVRPRLLSGCEEQPALGLGYASGSKRGSNIGPKLIAEILRVHRDVPQLRDGRIRHMEELQLVVPGMAEDRMSDTAAAVLKDFFIEYSAQQAADHGIPTFSLAPPSSIQVDISQSGETPPNCW